MSRRIAITGASGFLGAAVTADLLARGTEVGVLCRPESNNIRLSKHTGYTTFCYSLLSDESLKRELTAFRPDVFIHCGWRGVASSERNETFQFTENIPLTLESVMLAATVGCRHWIGMGSQAEYGNHNRRLDENAETSPTTFYGRAKLAAGISALGLCDANNIRGTWMRIFSTYGPGDSPKWFLPYVVRELIAGRSPALTKCEQLWDYLYVDDFARAVWAVIDSEATGVLNVGSGKVRPLREFVQMIQCELGTRIEPNFGAIPYRSDQIMHLEADITSIFQLTGWQPEINPTDGIRSLCSFERSIFNTQ